jgi:hypothetical protein
MGTYKKSPMPVMVWGFCEYELYFFGSKASSMRASTSSRCDLITALEYFGMDDLT